MLLRGTFVFVARLERAASSAAHLILSASSSTALCLIRAFSSSIDLAIAALRLASAFSFVAFSFVAFSLASFSAFSAAFSFARLVFSKSFHFFVRIVCPTFSLSSSSRFFLSSSYSYS